MRQTAKGEATHSSQGHKAGSQARCRQSTCTCQAMHPGRLWNRTAPIVQAPTHSGQGRLLSGTGTMIPYQLYQVVYICSRHWPARYIAHPRPLHTYIVHICPPHAHDPSGAPSTLSLIFSPPVPTSQYCEIVVCTSRVTGLVDIDHRPQRLHGPRIFDDLHHAKFPQSPTQRPSLRSWAATWLLCIGSTRPRKTINSANKYSYSPRVLNGLHL
jgi:hypothetical protein